MSSNFTGLNSNVAVPRAYTSVATIHTTYLYARVGCPLLLTSAHKQIVLQGLVCSYPPSRLPRLQVALEGVLNVL
jgi:hypothetical protein